MRSREDLRAHVWDDILRVCGLAARRSWSGSRDIYMQSKSVIICLRHGHHPTPARHAECAADREPAAAARQFRQAGAGICPVRGHSNVQGDRTVGIDEKPKPEFLDQLETVFGFRAAAAHGHDVVDAIQAMLDGRAEVFIGLGGNFVAAVPDTEIVRAAMRRLR